MNPAATRGHAVGSTLPAVTFADADPTPSPAKWEWAGVLAVTALGLLIRLLRPLDGPIWYDEAATWEASTATWGQLLAWRHHFEHPPLSFALVKLSRELFDTDAAWALRLPSFLAGVASIPTAWWAGRRLGGPACGAVLGLLVAGGMSHVTQSGHARMYTLLTLAALLLLGLLARTTPTTPGRGLGRGLLLGLALAMGVLSHNLALLLIPATLAAVLLDVAPWRARLTAASLAAALALAAASPGLAKLIDRAAGGAAAGGEVVPTEVDYVPFADRPAPPDARPLAVQVWLSLAVDNFAKDKGVSVALLALGSLGAVLAVRRRAVGGAAGAFLVGLILLTALALPIALRWHHSMSGRYLALAQLATAAGVAYLAARAAWSPARVVATALAVVVAGWGAIAAVTEPVEPQAITGALIELHQGELRDATLVCHSPKLRRLARYYGVARPVTPAQAPPPEGEEGESWLFVGHLRPQTGGSDAGPALAYLAAAAQAAGHPLTPDQARAARRTMRGTIASLWRVDPPRGVQAWTGHGGVPRPVDWPGPGVSPR